MLVDSEVLSASVLTALMAEVGMPITPEVFRNDFLGRSFASASARAAERFGKSLPADFNATYRARLLNKMAGNLKAMPGVEMVLSALNVPFCLATSSSPQRLAVSMAESKLAPWFAGRSFTASEVQNGKPAPDLFLHAAKSMAQMPEHTLVIEDSDIGLRAALAADMEVWHFRGGGHLKGQIVEMETTPQRVLDSMAALRDAFRDIGIAA